MIYMDIISSLERALGTSLDTAQRTSVIYSLAADFGGERYYMPSLSKHKRQISVVSFDATAQTLKQFSETSGVPYRTLKRLRNGK
jgi:hypothetical protein